MHSLLCRPRRPQQQQMLPRARREQQQPDLGVSLDQPAAHGLDGRLNAATNPHRRV